MFPARLQPRITAALALLMIALAVGLAWRRASLHALRVGEVTARVDHGGAPQ